MVNIKEESKPAINEMLDEIHILIEIPKSCQLVIVENKVETITIIRPRYITTIKC
jgi:hypothetical protein